MNALILMLSLNRSLEVPVLPLEVSLFPEDLLSARASYVTGARVWWVIHTKPRQEKSIIRQLRKNAVPFYLPLISRRSVISGRAVISHVPLFPSYVFLFGDREERITALATGRVVRVLDVAEQQDLWRDLSQVKQLIDTGAQIRPEGRLSAGTSVEISSGPLAGLKGTILNELSRQRFVVWVDFMQQGASVLLDDLYLTPVPTSRITHSTDQSLP
jgi:transcriptional antiterminator RfaH